MGACWSLTIKDFHIMEKLRDAKTLKGKFICPDLRLKLLIGSNIFTLVLWYSVVAMVMSQVIQW